MATASEVNDRLEQLYGCPDWEPNSRPLDELIQTILSQHTSDINSERAFRELKRRFPDWASIRAADHEAIADAIRSGGLADLKARRIRSVLEALAADDLNGLAAEPLEDARARLVALPSVGPKTAACVLLFACGLPALPVDTHVHRVALRLGLIPAGTSGAAAHLLLERQLAPGAVYAFHVNMIRHGRMVCRARAPRCQDCGVRDLCRFPSLDAG